MIRQEPFPARAGMNRSDEIARLDQFAVPRTRGDEPMPDLAVMFGVARSPHARG